jgi:hypothetical protein
LAWRCANCRECLTWLISPELCPAASVLASRRPVLWRYAEALPITENPDISLGEGMTPLVTVPEHPGVLPKVDYLMPTGSFKDRGAVVSRRWPGSLGIGCRPHGTRKLDKRCTLPAVGAPGFRQVRSRRPEVICEVFTFRAELGKHGPGGELPTG